MKRFFPYLCVALCVLPAAGLARGQVVVILDAGAKDGGRGPGHVRTLLSHLSDLPVRFVVGDVQDIPDSFSGQVALARRFAEAHAADKVLWLSASLNQVSVFFPEPGGGRILARTVEARSESERIEAISIIARNLIKAPVEASHRPAPKAPEMRHGERLLLRWGYVADFFSSRSPSPHGLSSAILYRVDEALFVYGGARFMESARVSDRGLELTVDRYPIEAGVGYRFGKGHWHYGLEAGGVLELHSRDLPADLGSEVLKPGEGAAACGLYLGAFAGHELGNSSELFVELGVSWFFNPVAYSISGAAGSWTLLETWAVRPMLKAGLNLGVY